MSFVLCCVCAGAASPTAQLALSQSAFLAPLPPHSVPGAPGSDAGAATGSDGRSSSAGGAPGSAEAAGGGAAGSGGAEPKGEQPQAQWLELLHGGAQLPAWAALSPSVLWLRVQAGVPWRRCSAFSDKCSVDLIHVRHVI